MTHDLKRLKQEFQANPFQWYLYSYPHKTAYRPIEPVALKTPWKKEKQTSLFLYAHIPFCESRCGYCNLLSYCNPGEEMMASYLSGLELQAAAIAEALPQRQFARAAIGGGTPTFLACPLLEKLLDIMGAFMGAAFSRVPASIEVSPATVTGSEGKIKLALLNHRRIHRISIGVQSFVDKENRGVFRKTSPKLCRQALDQIRGFDFPVLNIDLIYGLPSQTVNTWLYSIETALQYRPEEIYLYPLYIRDHTALGRRRKKMSGETAPRMTLYREGRAFLLDRGYIQKSLRRFQVPAVTGSIPQADLPEYSCQEDGMVGLGCGARSYTRDLHYSSRYAVSPAGIKDIIESYISQTEADFGFTDHGFRLSLEEQKRRYIIKSLLNTDGLDTGDYQMYFNTSAVEEHEELGWLKQMGLVRQEGRLLVLTGEGLALSDAIGPWLMSETVKKRMAGYIFR